MTIGSSFMVAGVVAGLTGLVALVVAGLTGLVALVVPLGAIGPLVVAGSVVLLVPVVVGVVIGTGRLRHR